MLRASSEVPASVPVRASKKGLGLRVQDLELGDQDWGFRT